MRMGAMAHSAVKIAACAEGRTTERDTTQAHKTHALPAEGALRKGNRAQVAILVCASMCFKTTTTALEGLLNGPP